MNHITFVRSALLGTAVLLVSAVPDVASAQSYPPGTNCLSLLPNLRPNCMAQARQLNSANGMSGSTIIPNSAGSNTVPTPGTNTNGVNSGTTVMPNTVQPNGTVSPNTVTPNGTVNPNAVGTPNSTPTANPVIIPPAGTTGIGTGTGTGAGGMRTVAPPSTGGTSGGATGGSSNGGSTGN